MFKRLFAVVVFLLWACLAPAQTAPALFGGIDDIVRGLSEITGLAPLKKIEHDTMTRDRLKVFFEERIREVVKPEEIRIEELVLKKFGFAPADFDLKATTIELMTEQAAAFYDFKRKKLFVLEGSGSMMQEVALIHELAHALADQHFKLERFLKKAGENDDGALARMAVMEGQATWLMAEYLARRTGGSLKDNPAMVEMMSKLAGIGAGQFTVFDKAPLYMRESLLFPYRDGMNFMHAVFMKLGTKGFSEVYQRPPAGTRDIMHPEQYFEQEKPTDPKPPELARPRDYRALAEGSVGEFDFSVLLRQYAGVEAARLAPQWRGGNYRLLERKDDKQRTLLLHSSDWASAEAAAEFFRFYRQVLKGKWKQMSVTRETGLAIQGRGDDGHFELRRDGARVTAVEGMKDPSDVRRTAIN